MKIFNRFELENRSLVSMAILFSVNALVFYGTRLTFCETTVFHHMATTIDTKIPFVPAMTIFYCGWFPYVLINFYIITKPSAYDAVHFASAHIFGELIAAIAFLAYPSTIDRPICTGTDIFSLIVLLTYYLDSPTNLFPSIHCFAATMAILGTIRRKDLKIQYRIFNILFGLGVYCSTVMIRQHVFVDVPAGIAVAVFSWFITIPFTRKFKTYKKGASRKTLSC